VPVVARARFNHVGQCVSDLERSRRFYVEVFGFEVARQLQPPDQGSAELLRIDPPLGMTACYLKRDDFILELLHFADAGTVPGDERVVNQLGLTHVSLSVDDLDAALAAVEANGGEVLTDTNIGVAIFVKDPDGQLVELLTAWEKP
jgi:catechol 2,3-dioxygenase-like lactoylglutathione lyase family enzyme